MYAIHLQGSWVKECWRVGKNGRRSSLYSSLRTSEFPKLNHLEHFLQVNNNKNSCAKWMELPLFWKMDTFVGNQYKVQLRMFRIHEFASNSKLDSLKIFLICQHEAHLTFHLHCYFKSSSCFAFPSFESHQFLKYELIQIKLTFLSSTQVTWVDQERKKRFQKAQFFWGVPMPAAKLFQWKDFLFEVKRQLRSTSSV